MMGINTIYFSTRIGEETGQVPFPVAPSLQFGEIIPEIAAKFGVDSQNLAIATAGGGNTLTPTDLLKTVEEVVRRYGNQFEIINRGIVGMGGGNKPTYGWAEGIVDQVVPKCPEKLREVNPKHPAWKTRVKFEVQALMKYLQFLKDKGTRPWFQLTPVENPKFNFMVWKGYLTVPDRSDIQFDIRILLTSDYPKVTPRCFAEQKILNYCGKIYTKNIWNDPEENGKPYVMICHDHMAEQNAWEQDLGIVHFFVREVHFWWGAQQNIIIQEFDKELAGLRPSPPEE